MLLYNVIFSCQKAYTFVSESHNVILLTVHIIPDEKFKTNFIQNFNIISFNRFTFLSIESSS